MKSSFLLLTLSACMTCSLIGFAQTMTHTDTAFAKAKPVLLAFIGSDWCANCIRFDKKIMHDPSFREYSTGNLVMLIADFPQQQKLSAGIVKVNDSLAAIYNPEGLFPKFVLIDPKAPANFNQVNYNTQNAADFITDIRKRLAELRL